MLPSKGGFNVRKALFFSLASFRVPLIFRPDFSPDGIPTATSHLAHFHRFLSIFLLAFQNIQFVCEVNGRLKKRGSPAAFFSKIIAWIFFLESLIYNSGIQPFLFEGPVVVPAIHFVDKLYILEREKEKWIQIYRNEQNGLWWLEFSLDRKIRGTLKEASGKNNALRRLKPGFEGRIN
ncbi:hypothetical protein AVEN_86946-1 [Araneus ventricosus]|uniref:Uncharacterized protein n=1 Tax=Araneus ventricosus TaxID=182803 RepID=A0A4Y2DXL7_ARAVE|nr:hypothetical protein AVEN_86946-1 [Araneus ventricosus]